MSALPLYVFSQHIQISLVKKLHSDVDLALICCIGHFLNASDYCDILLAIDWISTAKYSEF